ncbi:hypothetical protein JTB14_014797 [Gonioctena quinquepunctata]|nr:hypothetical protein JTB14_014797 [Gonioctena quinquepunctata]
MTDFISILLLMGIIQLPTYEDYWAGGTRMEHIASIMLVKRFKLLRRYIHFNDNSLVTPATKDRFVKIRPLIENIRQNCQKFHLENDYSVVETMVAYEGTRVGNLRQCIKNKPQRWGYKFSVIAGVSGLILDFIPYRGSTTVPGLKGTRNELTEEEYSLDVGAGVIISLCKSLHDPHNSIVYFDNYISSLDIFAYLKNSMNILRLGTLRADRIGGCPIDRDKILQKQGRGTYGYKDDKEKSVIIIKWVDNKYVLLGGTAYGVELTSSVKRYCKTAKMKTYIVCPSVISYYNKHMGGVDKANTLMDLYKTTSKAKRWYYSIFTYLLDISVVNAWLIYRNDCEVVNIKKYKPLKIFRKELASSLANTEKGSRRGSLNKVQVEEIKYPVVARPDDTARKDCVGHWPVHTTRGTCRFCQQGTSRFQCEKCNARLCITDKNNCFVSFHE